MTPITLRLRELREARGWSQAELGRRAGVRQAAISNLETGNFRRIDVHILEKLSKALDCPAGYLIVERGD